MNPQQPTTPTPKFDLAQTLRRNLLRAQAYAVLGATQEVISYINTERTNADEQVIGMDVTMYFEQVLRPAMLWVLAGLNSELNDEAINNQKVAVNGVTMVEDRLTNLQTLRGLLTSLYAYTAQL